MKSNVIPLSQLSLQRLRSELCKAYDDKNMPLVQELSRQVDEIQLRYWKENQNQHAI